MFSNNKVIGKIGEDLAKDYLEKKDYIFICCNYSTKLGEIDIIVSKDHKLHFIEVKTRISLHQGKPYEAVTRTKIRHLMSAAQIYLLKNKVKDCKLSLDVVSIWLNPDYSVRELLFFENVIPNSFRNPETSSG